MERTFSSLLEARDYADGSNPEPISDDGIEYVTPTQQEIQLSPLENNKSKGAN